MEKFELENDCCLELKQEMALVVLHCSRAKGAQAKESFSSLLGRVKERINSEKRCLHYLGKTRMVMQTGGLIEDIFSE